MMPSRCVASPRETESWRAIAGLAAVLLSGLILAGAAGAQTPPPQESGATFRTTVREVVLDLVVRDSRGRPVKDLKQDAVDVFEDGVRQEIRGFRLVPGREVRDQQAGKGTSGAAVGVAKPAYPLRAINLICIVYHNLPGDAEQLRYVLEATQRFLGNSLRPDTYIGVFRLDGRLLALYPFTENREELIQATRNGFAARPIDVARAAQVVRDANQGAPSSAPAPPATVPGDDVGGIVGRFAGEGAVRPEVAARQQLDQLTSMVQELGALPGRKTVLLFSPGVINSEDPERLQAIFKNANAARITIHAIDIHGLNVPLIDTAALNRVAATSRRQADINADSATMAANMGQMDALMTTVRSSNPQAVLRALSGNTGGTLIAGYDLTKPFQRILEDVDTHYEVTYHPTSQKLDGRLRTIVVKLARADWNVQSRTGYFAVPDLGGAASLAPFETAAFAALNAEPRPHAFDFYSRALQFRSGDSSSQYAVVFELPGTSLTPAALPGQNRQRLHFSLLAVVKDANGQVVAKISRDFPIQVSNDQLAALRASKVTHAQPIQLAPGRYTVETAVVDAEGSRSSTSAFQIDNPGRKGLGLSDVVLVQRVESATGQADAADPFQFRGRRVVPEIGASLGTNVQPQVYFVVYPDQSKTEKPSIAVEVLLDGKLIAQQTVDLPPPDPSGAISMLMRAVPRPGNCELKITALQGGDSIQRTIRYSIAAQ
jgi:VWFA-related protein